MRRWLTPVNRPFKGSIRVPGSKSVTIRALTASALAPGRSHLYGALVADDTRRAVGMLRAFGVTVDTTGEPWTVEGTGGYLEEPPDIIDAGDSGLTARIGIALAPLVRGSTTIDGSPRLRKRPIRPLVELLLAQGVDITPDTGRLPVTIQGRGGLWGGEMSLSDAPTSQLVTALLLAAPVADQPSVIRLPDEPVSGGYIDLTVELMRTFGVDASRTILGYEVPNNGYFPADLSVEPDMSSAVYPLVAAAITGSTVEVEGIRLGTSQPDVEVVAHLRSMGCLVEDGSRGIVVEGPGGPLHPLDADLSNAPDGALALAVAALFASGTSRISGLGSLRHKESNRMESMGEGLLRLGAAVEVDGDTIKVTGPPTNPAVIDPHGDHRVAMSLALAGLRLEGVMVSQPDVVDKTWPGFWEQMGALVESSG